MFRPCLKYTSLSLFCLVMNAGLIFFNPAPALAAGGPYVVEDAEVIETGSCEVEAWYARAGRHDWQTTLAPACNFLGDTEIGADLIRAREAGDRSSSLTFHGKTVLSDAGPDGVMAGLMAGIGYNMSDDRFDGIFALVPLSFDPSDDLRLNLNLGWEYERGDNTRHYLTWGTGFDWEVHHQVSMIGEIFGRHRGKPGAQIGLRPELIEDRLHLDIVYGRNLTGERDNWLTVGGAVRF